MKTCPTCHLMLQPLEWDGPAAWVCSSCGGVWADAANSDAVAERSAEIAGRYPGAVSTGMYEGLPMSCPQCRIVRLEAAPEAATLRWRCPKCLGVWMAVRQAEPVAPPPPPEPQAPPPPRPEEDLANAPAADTLPAPSPTRANAGERIPDAPKAAPTAETSAPSHRIEEPAPQRPAAGPRALQKLPETADEAMQRLQAGNRRYVEGASLHPNQDAARRAETERGQKPFAAVLGCSDSRVPPEILFDQGIGDLFVVREAGHVVGPSAQAGLAYAADALDVRLIVVLGHTGCGAVQAAVQDDGHYPYLQTVIDEIAPAVAAARERPGDPSDNAVRENVRRVVTQLIDANWQIADRVRSGRTAVMGAIYDVSSGRVEFMTELEPFHAAEPPAVDPSLYVTTTIGGEPDATIAPATVAAAPAPPKVDLDRTTAIPPEPARERQRTLWCPNCRKGYGEDQRYCVRCGVPLVPGDFRVPCPRCQRENAIASARCWACSEDLHPDPAHPAARPAPPAIPPRLRRMARVEPPSRPAETCSTQILAIAVVIALALWLPQIVARVASIAVASH